MLTTKLISKCNFSNDKAHPGPACYRKGGPLTVTDANLVLGRLIPEYFPKIFGPNENESLDYAITRQKFEELQKEINAFLLENGQRTVNLNQKSISK